MVSYRDKVNILDRQIDKLYNEAGRQNEYTSTKYILRILKLEEKREEFIRKDEEEWFKELMVRL